jgi:hypothetical protein
MRKRNKRRDYAPPRLIQFSHSDLWDIALYQRDAGIGDISQAVRELVRTGLEARYDTISEDELLAAIEALAPDVTQH